MINGDEAEVVVSILKEARDLHAYIGTFANLKTEEEDEKV